MLYLLPLAKLIVNIYLPNCIIKDDYVLELQDIFASIGNAIDNYAGFDVIVAGDFNFQFVSDNIGFQHLDIFMAEFHLGSCDYLLKTPPDYTFHIEKLGYRSFIDHFVCSSYLITKVDSLHILDSGCNLSDHLAIFLCVCSDNFLLSHPSVPDPKCNKESMEQRFRWDKANLVDYYAASLHVFSEFNFAQVFSQCSSSCRCENINTLDVWGDNINSALLHISNQTVPMKKVNFYKFWWNEELSLLKQNSIDAHRLWDSLGRPKSGEIWLKQLAAKQEYKRAIKRYQLDECTSISNELNDHLLSKDLNNFWKSW